MLEAMPSGLGSSLLGTIATAGGGAPIMTTTLPAGLGAACFPSATAASGSGGGGGIVRIIYTLGGVPVTVALPAGSRVTVQAADDERPMQTDAMHVDPKHVDPKAAYGIGPLVFNSAGQQTDFASTGATAAGSSGFDASGGGNDLLIPAPPPPPSELWGDQGDDTAHLPHDMMMQPQRQQPQAHASDVFSPLGPPERVTVFHRIHIPPPPRQEGNHAAYRE